MLFIFGWWSEYQISLFSRIKKAIFLFFNLSELGSYEKSRVVDCKICVSAFLETFVFARYVQTIRHCEYRMTVI